MCDGYSGGAITYGEDGINEPHDFAYSEVGIMVVSHHHIEQLKLQVELTQLIQH